MYQQETGKLSYTAKPGDAMQSYEKQQSRAKRAKVEKCGAALCLMPTHPPDASTAPHDYLNGRLRCKRALSPRRLPQLPPATKSVMHEEETRVEIVLGTISMSKKVSYPLPFWVWHVHAIF